MIGSIEGIEAVEVRARATGELFTMARLLSESVGIREFSVMHETLAPGHRASAPHFHSQLTELYIVLAGVPTVQIEDEEKRLLKPGGYVAFKPGESKRHVIANETEGFIELLRISSCPPDDVVTY